MTFAEVLPTSSVIAGELGKGLVKFESKAGGVAKISGHVGLDGFERGKLGVDSFTIGECNRP